MNNRLQIIFETVMKIMESGRSSTGLQMGSGATPPPSSNNTGSMGLSSGERSSSGLGMGAGARPKPETNNTGSMGIGSGERSSTGLSTGSSSNTRRKPPSSNYDMMM